MNAINLRKESIPNEFGIYCVYKRLDLASCLHVYRLNSESETVELEHPSGDWYFYKTSVSFSFLSDPLSTFHSHGVIISISSRTA
jgi:hypothetical protein